MKWRLLTRWFSSDRAVIAQRGYDPADSELGTWSRTKNYLARRWLRALPIMPAATGMPFDNFHAATNGEKPDLPTLGELISAVAPVRFVKDMPSAAANVSRRQRHQRSRSSLRNWSPGASRGDAKKPMAEGRSASSDDGSADGRPGSGVMVEEKGLGSEDERSDDGREERRRSFQERLNVPEPSQKTR